MMIDTPQEEPVTAVPALDPAQVLLRWRSHPVRKGGKKLYIVLASLIGMPGVLTLLYGPGYGLFGLVVLCASLGSFFLPTDYALYIGGGEMRFLGIYRRFTWQQFRSYYPDHNGVLLSPFPRPSRLENFRGLYLRFGDSAEEVMAVVSDRMAAPPSAVSTEPEEQP